MKNHHHTHTHPEGDNSTTAIHEAIAQRAYLLWEKRGKPESQAEALWIEAEHQLVTERQES